MNDRHAKEALLLQQRGASWLTDLDADDVSGEMAIRAITEGVRLERLARGEVTDATDRRTVADQKLEALDDGQLDDLIGALTQRLAGAGPPPA